MPPKRKAAAARASNNTTAAPPPTKQVKQDGQKAVSRDLDIPLDEGLLGRVDVMKENPRVYIDDDGIIYDASLNQSNVSNNNNKVCPRIARRLVYAAHSVAPVLPHPARC